MKIFTSLYFFLACLSLNAQLRIGTGISWKSDPATYVVLHDIGLQHHASSALLENKFRFTGGNDVTIEGTTLPLFNIIEINKTGTARIILQRSIEVRQQLSFISGLVELNNYSIDLSTTGLLNGEGENTRIIGANGGYIQIVNTLNAPNSVNPEIWCYY